MPMDVDKYKQIILMVLGVVFVVGLGFLAVRSNNSIPKQEDDLPNTVNTDTGKPVNPTDSTVQFNQKFDLKINDSVSFSDGLNVVLKKIDDSRCPKGVQCIWAGELTGNFAVSGGKMSKNQEIYLGTMTNKSVTLDGYTFSIKDATATNISILVDYKNVPVSLGSCYVGGCSAEICSDQPNAMSTCIYRKEFACYKTAKCERQKSNQCGWTETPELTACLSN
ncbi:hypothetical protein IT399_00275 [Candidatus Nomurabacteria bacterium]|nr:hypothetical protein [Candidatus Nomurabacteria bacterium]